MATPVPRLTVLELNTSLGYAGAQRTMISFCKYLNKDFFRVVAAAYGDGGPRERDLQTMKIPYVIGHGNLQAVVEFAQTENVDVVHFHRSGHHVPSEFELLQLLKKALPNCIVIETNVFGYFDKPASGLIDCHLLKSKMMLNERFVPASEQPFDYTKSRVVYNPVDAANFAQYVQSPEAIRAYRASLGIAPDDFVIGRFGRPDLSKWGDIILEMLPRAIRLIPNLKVIIQAAPAERLAWLGKFGKQVIILPETSSEMEAQRFYQSIDVLAHSSRIGEAFGNTLNEAMYWRKPIVVNSTPRRDNGQLEQVDHNKTGLIANTPAAFANALVYLAHNPQEQHRLGQNGHAKVTTLYSPENTTASLEKAIIESVELKRSVAPDLHLYAQSLMSLPTEAEIIAYQSEYQSRLKTSWPAGGVMAQIADTAYCLRRFVRRIVEFVQRRLR